MAWMPPTTLLLRDGQLWFHHEPASIHEPRPFGAADRDNLRAWAERYARALAGAPRDARVAFEAIGREMYAWLDGGDRWIGRAEDAGITPPWLFAVTVPKDAAAQPDEHALLEAPWELVWGAHGALAARADMLWCPVRRIGEAREPRAPVPNELAVMFMAAAPAGVAPLFFEEEEAAILDATRRLSIDLVVEESGTLDRLVERMAEEAPVDVLQLSCHGHATPSPRLALEDDRGRVHDVGPDALAQALGTNLPTRLLFLSACETADPGGVAGTFAAQMIRRGVPAAIGWGGSVRDAEASGFAAALYQRLSRKESLESAVAFARAELLGDRARPLGEGEPEAFHLARLYLGPEGGGPLTQGGPRRKRRADVDRAFLIRAARGNPGQSLLFKSAMSEPEACDRALAALERYHEDGSAPEDEGVRGFLEGLVIDECLMSRGRFVRPAGPAPVLGQAQMPFYSDEERCRARDGELPDRIATKLRAFHRRMKATIVGVPRFDAAFGVFKAPIMSPISISAATVRAFRRGRP